jgi:hypothetical protein
VGDLGKGQQRKRKGKKWQKVNKMAFWPFAFFASISAPKNRLSEWPAIKALKKHWLRGWPNLTVSQSVC